MIGDNARTLTFTSSELGKEVQILLVFDLPNAGAPFIDLFPVCWKTINFQPTGISSTTIDYTADTALLVPQVGADDLIFSYNAQRCEIGQKCTLRTSEDGRINYLTPAVIGDDDIIQCDINSDHPANLAIGFFNKAGTKIDPVLLWSEISKGSTFNVQPSPVLKIYAVTAFQATQLIRAAIPAQTLFEENLNRLPRYTDWVVSVNHATGDIEISRA